MNTQNVWIKRSEREANSEEYPLVVGGWSGKEWVECRAPIKSDYAPFYTHWRSIKCDPPPRELTQRERDDEAVDVLIGGWDAEFYRKHVHGLMLDAIRFERREVAKLLNVWFCMDNWGTQPSTPAELKAIRARLDEQGAK